MPRLSPQIGLPCIISIGRPSKLAFDQSGDPGGPKQAGQAGLRREFLAVYNFPLVAAAPRAVLDQAPLWPFRFIYKSVFQLQGFPNIAQAFPGTKKNVVAISFKCRQYFYDQSSSPGCASLALRTTREVKIYLGHCLELDRTTGRHDQP